MSTVLVAGWWAAWQQQLVLSGNQHGIKPDLEERKNGEREREREREREESPGIEEGGRSPSNSPILAKEPFSLKKDKNFFP
jgi:hypothetical protein